MANTATTGRIIDGVQWHDHIDHPIPKIGQVVYLRYFPSSRTGSVHAEIDKPNCNEKNIAKGIVRKRFSPNQNSYFVLTVEVTEDFPA